MSRKSYRAPLSAAALTILLAACGGGEGGTGASQHGLDSTQTIKEASTDAPGTVTTADAAGAAAASGDANAAPAPAAAGETPASPGATGTPTPPETPAAPTAPTGAPATDATAPADPAAPATPAPAADAGAPAAPGTDASQPATPPAPGAAAPATDGQQPANGKPTNTATEAAGGVPPVTPEAVVTAPDTVPTAQPMTPPAAMPTVGNSPAGEAARPPAGPQVDPGIRVPYTAPDGSANDAAQAPAGPQVDPRIRVPYTAPIGSQGVSGQVLATMLDQKGCDAPVPYTALDGEPMPAEQIDVPQVRADARISPENYAKVPNPATPNPGAWMFDMTCSPMYYTYQSMGEGDHELTVYSATFRHTLPPPQETRSLNLLEVKVPIRVANPTISLAREIQVTNAFNTGTRTNPITPPAGDTEEELTLSREADLSFQRTSHISYGVLAEWKQGDKVARLMLFPGKTDGEARLCWNTELSFVRRLQCKVWTAPEGWQPGQSLKYEGQYLIDDRSTYPGEEGMRFWKTRPLPETAQAQ
ncbi:MAG: hypothetical protein Q4B17_04605 [Lautropia sp.]|nr:hypothetical protein [Lautropia sp.]